MTTRWYYIMVNQTLTVEAKRSVMRGLQQVSVIWWVAIA
jgi:hypothetical protein